jgi:hypothetical protein
MGENFMSAATQIEDLISKKKQIIERAAGLLAEAVLDRIKSGNLTRNSEKDIKNAIRNFSSEEQTEILSKAIILIGMNNNSKNKSGYDDDDDYRPNPGKKVKSRSDIFGRRFDD